MNINIAKDYTSTPGGRYVSEGDYSGEDFRDKILVPAFESINASSEKLIVNMDGCFGYPSSFLDEAFGGLARIYGSKDVLNKIDIICEDEPGLKDIIFDYIKNCGLEK